MKKIIIVLLIIIGVMAGLLLENNTSVLSKVLNTNKKSNTGTEIRKLQEDVVVVPEDKLQDMLNILGLETDNNKDLYGSLQLINSFDGELSNLSTEVKKSLVVFYLIRNSLYTEITGDELEFCAAGSGICQGINLQTYNTISSKYNINESFDELFSGNQKYKDVYLITYGGTMCNESISNNFTTKVVDDKYILINEVTIVNKDTGVTTNKTIEYTFKSNNTGNLYLFSVHTK